MEYHKIQSVFKRDPENNFKTFLEGEWSRPEFGVLAECSWAFTEKVDGTNIRVYFNNGSYGNIEFKGRTDKAQTPPFLLEALGDLFDTKSLENKFGEAEVVLYGEGYGPKIQKGGGNYRDNPSFVLFDVNVNGMWLERSNVEDIGESLGIDVVPILSVGTLYQGIDMCKRSFKSTWGDFVAEGVVAKPATELFDRRGNRIITKIKCKDFY